MYLIHLAHRRLKDVLLAAIIMAPLARLATIIATPNTINIDPLN